MANRKNINIRPSSKTSHNPNNSWFGNAIKSMGLGSMEMIKNIAPSMYEFVSTTSSTTNEIVKDIRGGKISATRIADNMSSSPYIKLGKDVINNSISDLKSGKFINPERQKELDKEMEKRLLGGMDMDEMFENMDSMFDDVSFDDELDDDKVVVNNNNIINQESTDNAGIYATLMVSDSIQKQTEANMQASKASIETMVSISANQMMFTKQLGNNILGELGSINENLSAMIEYQNENITKYIEASLEYYNQTAPKKDEDFLSSDSSKNKVDPSSVFSKGGLNVKEYMNAIRGNIKKTYGTSMIGTLLDMVAENPEIITANPLGFIMPVMMEAMVPKVLKNSIGHLDKTFKSLFPTALGKLADLKGSSNSMLSLAGSIFGIKEERKNTFKLNTFEKGQIPFDGITKHSIVEIIPTYLRKILAAVSDSKEVAFDWNTGKYATVDSMRNTVYESIRNDTTSQFRLSSVGDELDKYKEMLTLDDQERFDKLIDSFFVALEKYDKHFDPFNNKNGDPFKNVYSNIDSDYGSEMGAFVRSAFKNMDTEAIMRLNGARQQAMRSRADMMKLMEQNPYEYNLFSIAGDMNVDEAIRNGHSNAFQVFDQRNRKKSRYSTTDILTDIKSVLYRGINVKIDGYGRYTVNGGEQSDEPSVSAVPLSSNNTTSTKNEMSDFEREMRVESAQYVSDLSGSHKTEEDINKDIQRFNDAKNKDFYGNQIDPTQETGNGPFATVRKKLYNPALVVSNKVQAMDNMLYAFMFGSGQQTFETMLRGLGEKIGKFRDKVIDDYVQPLATKLFGTKDENGYSRDGMFSNAQNRVKDFFSSMKHEFTGKGYTDSNGEYHEDKSEGESAVDIVKNTFLNIKNGTMEYLFGKKESEDGTEKESKGIVRCAMNSISDGFNTWSDMIFGAKFDSEGNKKEALQSMKEELAEKAPKTLAGGILGAAGGAFFGTKLGLLSSLFLPGGPISGAIVGSAAGFLSQSERFREFLFGKEDENGEHIEGLISKKTQDFFKENKNSIMGGAVVGTVKSMIFPGHGILTSLIGGPLAGAAMGAGLAMLKKTNAVQELLYGKGEEGEEGYKKGIITALKDKFKTKDGKNKFGMAASGALGGMFTGSVLSQFGIVGASLFGPVSGAVAGLALGIASSSDKFKDFMFGEYDEEKQKRQGGLVGKFGNYLNIEVLQPMKMKIQETALDVNQFFVENMLHPLQDAIDPFAHQLKLVGESISNKFHEITDKIADGVHDMIIQPISDGVNKYLLDPMKKFTNLVFNSIFGLVKGIVGAPFKFLSYVTNGMVENHKERSFNIERDKIWQRDNTKGEKGFKGVINSVLGVGSNIKDTVLLYADKNRREDAEAANAEYVRGRDERIRERNERNRSKFDQRREELRQQRENYNARQRNARDNGYVDITDSTDEDAEDNVRRTERKKRRKKEKPENKRQSFMSRMFKGRRTSAKEEEDEESTNATLTPETENDEKVTESTKEKETTKTTRKATKKTKTTTKSKEESEEENTATLASADDVEDATDNNVKRSSKSIKEALFRRRNSNKKNSSDDEKEDTTKTVSKSVSAPSGASTSKYRSTMMKNITDIRNEIKGQFNGVGINISKIRRILVKRLKDDDTDVKGQDNNAELSIVDRIMYALGNPLKAVTGIITTPFKALASLVGGVVSAAKGAWDWIKSIPGKIISAGGKILKGFASGVAQVGKAILSVPKALGAVSVEIVKGTAKVVSAGVKGILEGASTLLKGAASLFGSVLKTTGDMIVGTANLVGSALAGLPKFIEGTAKAIGEIGSGIVSTIGKVGKGIISMIGTGLKTSVDLIGSTLKTASDVLTTTASGILSVLGTPFKIVGGLISKATGSDKKAKVLQGGTLDGIRNPIKVMNAVEPGNKALHVIIDDSLKVLSMRSMDESKHTSSEGGPTISQNIYNQKTPLSSILVAVGSIASGISSLVSLVTLLTHKKDSSDDLASVKVDTNINQAPTDNVQENSTHEESKRSMKISLERFKFAQRKKKEAEQKKEDESKFVTVSRKTSEYMMKQNALATKEEVEEERKTSILSMLTDIRQDTKEHKIGWDKIFSKKGLITGGLILAFPLIMKLVKKLLDGNLGDILGNFLSNTGKDLAFGIETSGGVPGVVDNIKDEVGDLGKLLKGDIGGFIMDDNNEFTNTSEARVNILRAGVKTAVSNIGKVKEDIKPAANIAKRGINFVKNKAQNIISKVTGRGVTETTANGVALLGQAPKEKPNAFKTIKNKFINKLNQSGTQVLDESGKVIATFDQSLLNKCKNLCDDAFKGLEKAFGKLFSKFGVKDTGKFASIIAKASKCIDEKAIIAKGAKFLKVLGKGAAAALTLASSEAVWAALGTISGASNAANLFQIDSEYVDGKMVAISAVFRGLLYTTIGSVVDIINEIVYSAASFNFIHELALVAYDLISSKDDYERLMTGKDEFKEEYLNQVENEYLEGYEAFKKAGGNQDYDEWRETSGYEVTSFSDFNNSRNKSIYGKMWDGIKAVGGGIKKGTSWLGNKISTGASWLGNGIKSGLSAAGNGIVSAGKWVGNKASQAFDWTKDKVTKTASNIKNNILGGAFNDDAIRKEFGLSENQDITKKERFSMMLNDTVKKLTFGTVDIDPEAVNGTLITIKKKAEEAWTNASIKVSNTFNNMKKSLTEAPNKLNNFLGNIFGFSDDDGNPLSATEGIKRKISRKMDQIVKLSSKIKDDSAKWWSDTKETLSNEFEETKKHLGESMLALNKGLGSVFGMQDNDGNPLSLTDGIKYQTENTIEWGREALSSIRKGFKSWWTETQESSAKLVDDMRDGIKNGAKSLNDGLGSVFGMQDDKGNPLSLTDGVVFEMKNTINWGRNAIKSIRNGFKGWWDDTQKNLSTFWSDTKKNVSKAMDKTNDWFGSLFGFTDKNGKPVSLTKGISESVNNIGNNVGNTWNSFIQPFKNFSDDMIKVSRESTSQEMPGKGPSSSDSIKAGMGDSSDMKNNFALYAQGDERWGNNRYFDSTIKAAGCGPTSMAMIASSLLGNKYYPSEMAKKSSEWGTYVQGAGTSWSFFPKAGKYYGLDVKDGSATKDSIVSSINSGQPVILSGKTNGVKKENSPFTTAGHFVVAHGAVNDGNGLIINDPRGDSYSKIYNTKDVIKGARHMWSFKANGSQHPLPLSGAELFPTYTGNSMSYSGSSSGSGTTNIFDIMSSFMNEFSNRAYNGLLTGNWDSDYSGFFSGASSSSQYSSSGALSTDTMATNLIDELAEKVLEITQAGEGAYDSVNANDNGSYSVGIMQFHGTRAKEYFERLANILPNQADANTALQYARMSNRALNSAQANAMKEFLNKPNVRNSAEPLQKTYAQELIKSSNMKTALEMYNSGVLKDPRSVILISDIANTGPAHVDSWRKAYKPVTNKDDELTHVRDSLKSSDSYWGRSTSQYHKGWMNRIDNSYEKLSVWTPKYDPSIPKGFGDGDDVAKLISPDEYTPSIDMGGGFGENPEYNLVTSVGRKAEAIHDFEQEDRVENVMKELNRKSKDDPRSNILAEKIDKIIEVLCNIDGNTLSTSKRISDLKSNISSISLTTNKSQSPVVINRGPNTTDLQPGQPSKNELLARKIAAGTAGI